MYGYTGDGCSGHSVQLFNGPREFLEGLSTPWVIGGDMNIEASNAGFLVWWSFLGATIVAPKVPPRNQYSLDV
eukprot:5300976-Pyramimonas_sp.AAC.1